MVIRICPRADKVRSTRARKLRAFSEPDPLSPAADSAADLLSRLTQRGEFQRGKENGIHTSNSLHLSPDSLWAQREPPSTGPTHRCRARHRNPDGRRVGDNRLRKASPLMRPVRRRGAARPGFVVNRHQQHPGRPADHHDNRSSRPAADVSALYRRRRAGHLERGPSGRPARRGSRL